jgi:hypothetical protein
MSEQLSAPVRVIYMDRPNHRGWIVEYPHREATFQQAKVSGSFSLRPHPFEIDDEVRRFAWTVEVRRNKREANRIWNSFTSTEWIGEAPA